MPARTTARFANLPAAALFYGFKARRFHDLKKIGKEARDLLPYDYPDRMPAWWERRQAEGRLAVKCPQSVLDRAGESVAPLPGKPPQAAKKRGKSTSAALKTTSSIKSSPVLPPGKQAETYTPAPQPIAIHSVGNMSHADMVTAAQEMFQTFHRLYREEITTNGVTTPLATRLFNQRQAFEANLERLMKAGKHFREEQDWIRKEEVVSGAQAFISGLINCIRSALVAEFPNAEQEKAHRAMDKVAARIGDILPKAFS